MTQQQSGEPRRFGWFNGFGPGDDGLTRSAAFGELPYRPMLTTEPDSSDIAGTAEDMEFIARACNAYTEQLLGVPTPAGPPVPHRPTVTGRDGAGDSMTNPEPVNATEGTVRERIRAEFVVPMARAYTEALLRAGVDEGARAHERAMQAAEDATDRIEELVREEREAARVEYALEHTDSVIRSINETLDALGQGLPGREWFLDQASEDVDVAYLKHYRGQVTQ